MDINTLVNIILLIIFLGLTAFFVAVEFAVVKVRISRLDQLIAEGNKRAVTSKKVAKDLDYYLSACQLGITVTAIGLGAFTKPYVKQLMYPVFDWLNVSDVVASVLSYGIALAVVSYLHVVIGEMAPKTLAIEFSEKVTLLLAPALYWFGKVMYPFVQALNRTSRLLLRGFGVQPAGHEQAYSEEELKIIMAQSFRGGAIDQVELQYLENVFSFDERVAKDILVPRTDLVVIDKNMSYEDIIQILDEHNYTRYPIVEDGDKDRIIGVMNAKKLLTHIVSNKENPLEKYVREVPFVAETTHIQDALLKMQQMKVHMTVVIDEYGGTAGILTMEDVLEELVGEIRDEFDADEVDEIRQTGKHEYIISGRVLLEDLEDRFSLAFQNSKEIDTIGGWIQYRASDAEEGQVVQHAEHSWRIAEMEHYQIKEVVFHQYSNKSEVNPS
ncbi:MAG: hemolysin family protein [Solibacillus sp.]